MNSMGLFTASRPLPRGVVSIMPYMRHVMYIAIDDFPPTRDACRPRKQLFRARIDALRFWLIFSRPLGSIFVQVFIHLSFSRKKLCKTMGEKIIH